MHDTLLRLRQAATVELVPSRTTRRVMALAAFAIATALAAHVRVPLPLTPVPVTLQSLFVVLSGALLGPALGAGAMMTYLGMGLAGLPVFSGGGFGPAHLLGPTGGYLMAFPFAAYAAGLVTDRAGRQGLLGAARLVVGLFVASLVVLAGGWAWLAILTGDPAGALALGVLPFAAGDVVKVALAALLAWRGRDRTRALL